MDSNDLNQLAQIAKDSSDPEQQLAAVQEARKMLTSRDTLPINDFIKSDMLPTLVGCLKEHNQTMVQYEAAWALTNIATGTSEQTNQVVAAGAVPLLLQLFSSPAPNVCEQAVWALGNIIGDGPELRDYVIRQGVIQPLLSLIKPDISITILQHVARFISNLFRYSDAPPSPSTIIEILPALNVLLQHTDISILYNAVLAVRYLTKIGNYQIHMVIDSNVVPNLISLLGHTEVAILTVALRAVGNIVAGSDERIQEVLNCNALEYFPALLTHATGNIRKVAVYILSKITAGHPSQLQEVINVGLMAKIIENLSKGDFQIQKDAAWVIKSSTKSGNRHQVFTLIKKDVIGPFCDLLECQDTQAIYAVLDGLNNMLKVAGSDVRDVFSLIEQCNGLEKIENLRRDDNIVIHKLAIAIMQKYFSYEACGTTSTLYSSTQRYTYANGHGGNRPI